MTPNPDLACNRHIKFGALLGHCKGLGADMVATGHYARTAKCGRSGQIQLLRGADPSKDQSYFLASVHGKSLAGDLPKPCCICEALNRLRYAIMVGCAGEQVLPDRPCNCICRCGVPPWKHEEGASQAACKGARHPKRHTPKQRWHLLHWCAQELGNPKTRLQMPL